MENKNEGSFNISEEYHQAAKEGSITRDLLSVIEERIVNDRQVINMSPKLQRMGYTQVEPGPINAQDMKAFMSHPQYCDKPYMHCIRSNYYIQSLTKTLAMVVRVKLESHVIYATSHPGAIIMRDLFRSVKAILLCIGIGASFGITSFYLVKTTRHFVPFQTLLAVVVRICAMLCALPLIARVRRLAPFLGMLTLSIFTWVAIVLIYALAKRHGW
jgi:hypothetical protein